MDSNALYNTLYNASILQGFCGDSAWYNAWILQGYNTLYNAWILQVNTMSGYDGWSETNLQHANPVSVVHYNGMV